MRVLVVDDEPDIRFILTVNLQRWGYEVEEASDAAAAYEVCRTNMPDIMLLDVSMPGETGLELIGRLREQDLMPPGVALLSAAFPGTLAAVATTEGIRHLSKPFGLAELEAMLADLAEQSRGSV